MGGSVLPSRPSKSTPGADSAALNPPAVSIPAVLSTPGAGVPLLLVDGHQLLWRGTFGFPAEIRSRDKTRTLTGLFAFFALLRIGIRDNFTNVGAVAPEVVVVFDGQFGSRDRQETDASYKAQRPTDEQALSPITFLPDVKRALTACDLAWIELEDHEADDVIASLTYTATRGNGTPAALPGTDRPVVIMSSDRDFYQLVTPQVLVLHPANRPARRWIDPAAVREHYGVDPFQWNDFRALTGDPADNIPGVRGIGGKTAATLLADGMTLDNLPGSGRLTSPRACAVTTQFADALRWRDMMRVRTDIDVPIDLAGTSSTLLPAPAAVLDQIHAW